MLGEKHLQNEVQRKIAYVGYTYSRRGLGSFYASYGCQRSLL
jgi:hypothetical protein